MRISSSAFGKAPVNLWNIYVWVRVRGFIITFFKLRVPFFCSFFCAVATGTERGGKGRGGGRSSDENNDTSLDRRGGGIDSFLSRGKDGSEGVSGRGNEWRKGLGQRWKGRNKTVPKKEASGLRWNGLGFHIGNKQYVFDAEGHSFACFQTTSQKILCNLHRPSCDRMNPGQPGKLAIEAIGLASTICDQGSLVGPETPERSD